MRPVADAADRLFVEGGLTPTELRTAADRGVAKLFPARRRTRLPQVAAGRTPRRPHHGHRRVTVDTAADWLAAGAFTVSIGSDLYRGGDVRANVARLRASLRA
ncbi:hypothetical protein NKH18_30225 [Streptomyces sp. M10(2022)]